jgi:two-component system, sensor histidine kinase and response regulator
MIGESAALLRLLIVDDSPEDRAVYRRLLSGLDEDFEVAEAESADQGLALCQSFGPDCVLLDYRLPDMTGLEFLADLAGATAPGQVAVVMLTGQGDETVAVEAMKWGAQDYLVKHNLTPDSLQQAIQNAVELCHLRRTIEEQRRQLERKQEDLERSNRELERYARVVAHDLEAPLKTLRTGLQGLSQRSGAKLDDASREFVQETMESTDRMGRLIRGILDYSRASANTAPNQRVDMSQIAQAAVSNLKAPIEEKGAEVRVADLPVVTGDEAMLVQVMQNLIGNGLKYQPKDARPLIEVSACRENDEWHFRVRDNGIGLDPVRAERIFEPFIRLHSTEYEGTGVGLAVCRAVVERHGGKIWVEGVPAKGSTFHFTLPARDGAS